MKAEGKKKHSAIKIILYIVCLLVMGIVIYKVITGYEATLPKFTYTYGTAASQSMVTYPDTSFAVMSDTHYYDTSLGTTGKAFEDCMSSDRKLLLQSAELLGKAVDGILTSGVKFVLVTGDLTKDGERLNHQMVAQQLQRLVDKGIKVYVIPGNHDIENPQSVKYDGDKTSPVPNISASDFANIYKNCGYGDAIMRDSGSLSYVAEPQNGLWLVALDSCEYQKNKEGGEETVGGQLTQSEIDWLETVFKKANDEGKAIIVMEHHGVVEHWEGQSKLHPDYLLSDYKFVGKFFSSYGVRLVFTGHYHAQDITLEDNGADGFIYDVETGSLITTPCSVRYCSIADNNFTVKTVHLIDGYSADFQTYAYNFVKKTIYNEAYKTLTGYKVPKTDADYIANTVADAYIAHYNGDENEANRVQIDKSKLSLWSRIVYSQYSYVINGLWKDLPPTDNNVSFSLAKAA